jgi:hypothetical protein
MALRPFLSCRPFKTKDNRQGLAGVLKIYFAGYSHNGSVLLLKEAARGKNWWGVAFTIRDRAKTGLSLRSIVRR